MRNNDLRKKFFMDNYVDIAIEEYLKIKETEDYVEKYKREVLSEINNYLKNIKITAENVFEIVKYFQGKNLEGKSFIDKGNLDDLLEYAKKRLVEVAELFNYLDEVV
ncbi:MAG TPA: hypothetical protein GXX15_04805 [Clostridia bacterium]|nr:hypothetical protein [Clostridia bacterium]